MEKIELRLNKDLKTDRIDITTCDHIFTKLNSFLDVKSKQVFLYFNINDYIDTAGLIYLTRFQSRLKKKGGSLFLLMPTHSTAYKTIVKTSMRSEFTIALLNQ